MVQVCVRRHSDSQFSRAIHEAIKKVCYQKQCPNEERILRFVLREFDWKACDISKQLRLAVKDGLFRETIAISHKGSKKGNEQQSFRINLTLDAVDADGNSQLKEKAKTHDWYCFDCQEPGEVILCDFCPRVFHAKCASNPPNHHDAWKCPSCKASEETNSLSSLPKEKIATMLEFTIKRLREKFGELTKPVALESDADYQLYINHPTDLSCIEKEVSEKKFNSPGHLLEELKYLVHNAVIYFGDDDEITVTAEELIEDAKQEMEEMLMCPDCYYLSNSKPKDWFCKPCNPPHELVWAQMKSQPPWPAKVLKWNEDKTKALVRFFESRHQRAWVCCRNIAPITKKPDVKKRPRSWLLGYQELLKYQDELSKINGGDVKPKIESVEEEDTTDVDKDSLSNEPLSYFVSVSCQTDKDNNKMIIGKLRQRIDDLEQDLKLTNDKVKLKQEDDMYGHLCTVKENGACVNGDTKRTLQKLVESLERNLPGQNGGHQNKDFTDIDRLLEMRMLKFKSAWEVKTQEDINQVKNELTLKHEKEIQELLEKEQSQRQQFTETLVKQKLQEMEETKKALHMSHQQELAEIRKDFEHRRREFEESQNTLLRRNAAEANELRTFYEHRRRRELEDARSSLIHCHEIETHKLRNALNLERQNVMAKLKREHEEILRDVVRETKRKQWCCNCEQEASYPCCWNTSYCSRQCQVIHWQQHRLQCSRNLVYFSNPTGSI